MSESNEELPVKAPVKELTPEEIELQENQRRVNIDVLLDYGFSRSKLGLCKNEGCYNSKDTGSSRCRQCSENYKLLNERKEGTENVKG